MVVGLRDAYREKIMKAIVLHDYGDTSALKYETVPDPVPKADEVLVRVHATSVNPVDWMVRSGIVRDIIPITFPFILGNDLAGTVAGLGKDVTGFKIGDQVMGLAFGTYAELCVVKAQTLILVPKGLDLIQASALPLINLTGDQLAMLGAKASAGQTVIVTGALGSVGRSAVFAAVQAGANVIAGVRGRRVDEARKLPGIIDVIALDNNAAIEGLPMVDAVADTIGGEIAAKLIQKVKPGGCFGCFPSTSNAVGNHPNVEVNSIFAQPNVATTRRYAEAVRDGRLPIPVVQVLSLIDTAKAQEIAEKGAGGKVILQIQ